MVLQNALLSFTVSFIFMKIYQGFHLLINFGVSSQLKGKVDMALTFEISLYMSIYCIYNKPTTINVDLGT